MEAETFVGESLFEAWITEGSVAPHNLLAWNVSTALVSPTLVIELRKLLRPVDH